MQNYNKKIKKEKMKKKLAEIQALCKFYLDSNNSFNNENLESMKDQYVLI